MKYVLIILSIFLSESLLGQYLETFPLANKGIVTGPCSGSDGETCASFDFSGVDWMINGNLTGIDDDDFILTSGGVLEIGGDVDEEVCFETPALDISGVGSVSFSVDLTWTGHDGSDYIDVEYRIDEGGWIQIPNVLGGGIHTIDFPDNGNSGSQNIGQSGISGNTLNVRVCADSNTSSESTTIDNVSVPQAGVVILPVTWSEVGAKAYKNRNVVSWATSSEINNQYFEVERKGQNDTHFHSLGKVEGAGTTLERKSYTFVDETPIDGLNLYRIKQVDFDGKYDYSPNFEVVSKVNTKYSIFPNPFSEVLVLKNNHSIESPSVWMLYDGRGQLIKQFHMPANQSELPLTTEDLPANTYFIKTPNQQWISIVKQ